MIDVIVPVITLSTAPLRHHSRENTSEIAHKDIEALTVSLERSAFATLDYPGVSRVAHSMLKVHNIHRIIVCNPVKLQQVSICRLTLELLMLDPLSLHDVIDAALASSKRYQLLR